MPLWDENYPAPSSADGRAYRERCQRMGVPDPYGARYETPGCVIEDVMHILATVPGTAFYDDTGHALILTDEDRYIISVSPPDPALPGFNSRLQGQRAGIYENSLP